MYRRRRCIRGALPKDHAVSADMTATRRHSANIRLASRLSYCWRTLAREPEWLQVAKTPTIVIADDDAFIRGMLRLLLRSGDYDVVGEAANGKVALDMCKRLRPDVALLDINMPVMDGLAVLQELSALSGRTKIVVVSGEATLDKVQLAMSKGAVGFIVKPFRTGTVLDELRTCLQRAE